MIRRAYIEQIRRLIYNGQPSDDATIGVNLVNTWLNQAIGVAAKQSYKDSAAISNVLYVNNSFYTSFNNLSVTSNGQFVWKIELPQIPFGIGQDEGISTLQFQDNQSKQLSQSVIWLTQNQNTFFNQLRPIPNKILAVSNGKFVYVYSTIMLSQYKANVTMISGGDSTDLDSILNVPDDYLPIMTDYIMKNLFIELNQATDVADDGLDVPNKTA